MCVMVSVLVSSAINRGFEPRSGQIKDHKIGICCFSAKHAVSIRKRNDWLARNQIIIALDASTLTITSQIIDAVLKTRIYVIGQYEQQEPH
jgi:hypothetical protein